jgi:hypothetical protein
MDTYGVSQWHNWFSPGNRMNTSVSGWRPGQRNEGKDSGSHICREKEGRRCSETGFRSLCFLKLIVYEDFGPMVMILVSVTGLSAIMNSLCRRRNFIVSAVL